MRRQPLSLFDAADWSGYDLQGNIIYAMGDKLLRKSKKSGVASEIADFSSLTPDPKPAPEWAKSFTDK